MYSIWSSASGNFTDIVALITQNQSPEGVLVKKVFRKTYRKTPVSESLWVSGVLLNIKLSIKSYINT